jgi:hypothetical protein
MKRNIKIDFTGLDAEIELEAAKSYVQHRINIGKPLTQRAFELAMKKSLLAFEVGMTPTELIDFTVDKGWQGINIEYTRNAIGGAKSHNVQNYNYRQQIIEKTRTKDRTITQQLSDRSWAT